MLSWEDKFRDWSKAPTTSETERAANAEQMIRNAVNASPKLSIRNAKVFLQGSYRNRTNIRRESDVDVGIVCYDTFFYDLPENTQTETFGIGPATYSYANFKEDVESALRDYFSDTSVTRGDKAFGIRANSYHLEADVAPFFEHRRYIAGGGYLSGVELRPDSGSPLRVINWPEQHYENGNEKNKTTHRSYRALVRIMKNLRCEMDDDGSLAAKPITSFLCECLVWNAPNHLFSHSRLTDDLREILIYLFESTSTDAACEEWGEVSELKYLFRPIQKWTRTQANNFIQAAWNYAEFT